MLFRSFLSYVYRMCSLDCSFAASFSTRNTKMAFRSVSLIRNEDSADPIEVRLIRKWKSFAIKDECCYLFLDKEGCGHNRDKAYLDAKLNLHGCYRIFNYLSQRPRRSHNVVPQQATIKISKGTSFMPIDPSGFPPNYFNFLPFGVLPDRLDTNFLLTDYIGRFDTITMDKIMPSGRRLLKFLLEDLEENYIEVALWQEIANIVDVEKLINTPFPCIVAVTSMKVKQHQQIQLESNSPTHVYINPEVIDTDDLIERFKIKYRNIPENLRGRYTVAQLLQINPAQNFERRFSCMAKVTDFVYDKIWFYRGCMHCNRKLLKRSPGWACSYHPNEQQQNFMQNKSVPAPAQQPYPARIYKIRMQQHTSESNRHSRNSNKPASPQSTTTGSTSPPPIPSTPANQQLDANTPVAEVTSVPATENTNAITKSKTPPTSTTTKRQLQFNTPEAKRLCITE
ncbi:hypothetical protein M8C21_010643 [Ambrosia artemisiifolia]|uniref:Nucleic acid-binding protein n=1 Tax=Ambrosia artemisiifolia TaxID=4212 RepID=A0AAD5D3W3_AMBAR|nr:hypothetical protein M8C21_010643 [Ambrosia artemisiifolia]